MVHKSTFEVTRKRYKQAQVEKFKESEKEKKINRSRRSRIRTSRRATHGIPWATFKTADR